MLLLLRRLPLRFRRIHLRLLLPAPKLRLLPTLQPLLRLVRLQALPLPLRLLRMLLPLRIPLLQPLLLPRRCNSPRPQLHRLRRLRLLLKLLL
jgi:hypothetical protein